METFWDLLPAIVVLLAVAFGVPFLLRGGGRLRRGYGQGGRRGWGVRVRYGPSTSALLALAALRRVDTLLLATATVAVVVLVVVNATA